MLPFWSIFFSFHINSSYSYYSYHSPCKNKSLKKKTSLPTCLTIKYILKIPIGTVFKNSLVVCIEIQRKNDAYDPINLYVVEELTSWYWYAWRAGRGASPPHRSYPTWSGRQTHSPLINIPITTASTGFGAPRYLKNKNPHMTQFIANDKSL